MIFQICPAAVVFPAIKNREQGGSWSHGRREDAPRRVGLPLGLPDLHLARELGGRPSGSCVEEERGGKKFKIAMASWDNVGELSNIAQLTGLDAVKLISLIVKAASTARLHKRNCRRFAQHLKLIGGLLEQLRVSELRKYPETREPLEQLEDALRRGYLLVNSCQDRSYLYLLAMGWNIVYQFRKAQNEIDNYLRLVPLITLVDNARIRVGNQLSLVFSLTVTSISQNSVVYSCRRMLDWMC